MSNRTYDTVVVGGSWAGLSAAMQLARARRRVLLVDAGLPRNRFATTSHGFLGQDGRTPAQIIEAARAQVLAYPTVEFRQDEVITAGIPEAPNETFDVALASGHAARARRIVLATGVIDELPEIPGLRERWGKTVLHCPYCHGYEVAGERIGLLATDESSVHKALLLPDWSDNVTLLTNGVFEPTEDQLAALTRRGVRIDERRVVELVGDGTKLDGVRLAGAEGDDVLRLDALFTSSRTRMASPIAERLGCAFEDGPFGPVIQTDPKKQTTVVGVYAAGDAARVPHNATWASADGVTAGISAHQSLAFA